MDHLLQLMSRAQAAASDVMLWQRSTEMCSRDAHNFMSALMVGWMLLLIFSVWLYRRINQPKTKNGVLPHEDGAEKHLAPNVTSL